MSNGEFSVRVILFKLSKAAIERSSLHVRVCVHNLLKTNGDIDNGGGKAVFCFSSFFFKCFFFFWGGVSRVLLPVLLMQMR
jgi:hypothetical protein